MVNEIFIPKTEEVREIKSEIPSYEEFLKNYKVDERVKASYDSEIASYDDLFDGGYGPCYYSNPNCVCLTSLGWIQLYLGCPAKECTDRFREGGGASTWVHATCENPIYVSRNLEIKCLRCNNPSNMLNWSFNCFSSKHKGGYRETSYEIVANALTMLSNENRSRDKRVRDIIKTISDKLWDMEC